MFGFCSAALPEAPCAHWGICCAHAHCLGVHSGPSRRPLIPSSAFYPLLKARDAETCVVRSRARYASVQPGIFVMSTHMHLGRCPRVPVAASCSPTGHQFHRIDFTYLGLADTLLRPPSSASNSWASCLVKLLSSISAGVWSLSSIPPTPSGLHNSCQRSSLLMTRTRSCHPAGPWRYAQALSPVTSSSSFPPLQHVRPPYRIRSRCPGRTPPAADPFCIVSILNKGLKPKLPQ